MATEKAGFITPSNYAAGREDYGDDPARQKGYRVENDVFGDERGHGIHYRTLTWQLVSFLMITEIVTYGTLSLPYSLAVVGLVPGIILIVFLGVFALYTALILIKFKINHPEGIDNLSILRKLLSTDQYTTWAMLVTFFSVHLVGWAGRYCPRARFYSPSLLLEGNCWQQTLLLVPYLITNSVSFGIRASLLSQPYY